MCDCLIFMPVLSAICATMAPANNCMGVTTHAHKHTGEMVVSERPAGMEEVDAAAVLQQLLHREREQRQHVVTVQQLIEGRQRDIGRLQILVDDYRSSENRSAARSAHCNLPEGSCGYLSDASLLIRRPC